MKRKAAVSINETAVDRPLQSQQRCAGEKLRMLLLDRFTMGSMTGADVAEISYWVTEAGGHGLGDLGLRPEQGTKHGHEHVRLHAGKIFPEPDLTYIPTPLYVKRECRRVNEQLPMMLPSKLFSLYVEKPEVPKKSEKRKNVFQGLPCYDQHPVVVKARSEGHESMVRPVALYWDGVSYSAHDSFTGFYVTDLSQSRSSFLAWLVQASKPHVPSAIASSL